MNAAYEVLSDAEKRAKYEKYGAQWEQADQIEEMQKRQSSAGWARTGGADAYGDFGGVFDTLFRRERAARGPVRRRGPDVESPVEISLEDAFRGATRTVSLGSAEVCPSCGGRGEVGDDLCASCQGAGQVSRPRRLEVKIPAGVKTGSRVRVAGEGRPGTGGGAAGDLFLVVTVQDHPRFERKGDNLAVEVGVPLLDAVLGGEVEVPTLDGRVVLRIPELTQNGKQFRLAGKGMPMLGPGAGRGDLYAKVRVLVPDRLEPEERGLFEQMCALRSAVKAD